MRKDVVLNLSISVSTVRATFQQRRLLVAMVLHI